MDDPRTPYIKANFAPGSTAEEIMEKLVRSIVKRRIVRAHGNEKQYGYLNSHALVMRAAREVLGEVQRLRRLESTKA